MIKNKDYFKEYENDMSDDLKEDLRYFNTKNPTSEEWVAINNLTVAPWLTEKDRFILKSILEAQVEDTKKIIIELQNH